MRGNGDRSELKAGWPVLAACLLGQMLGVHTIPVYTAGLFVTPLHDDLGWTRTAVSAGVMIMTFATAAMAPVVGWLIGRFESRHMLIGGLAALSLCYLGLSHVSGSVLEFWALLVLMAVLAAGSSSVTISRLVVSRFDRSRGTALGLALLGTGVTSIVAPIVVGSVIQAEGWRAGYQALAAVLAVGAALVATLFMAVRHRSIVQPIRKDVGHRSTDAAFRLLAAFFLISFGTGGAVIHFVPMLEDAGWSLKAASSGAALLGASLVLGRLITGLLLDRVDPLRLATILTALSSAGFLLLCFAQGSAMLLLAPLIGMSLGAELDLMPYLVAREMGLARFGRVYGMFYAAFLIGAGASTLIYALLQRIGGDYRLAFIWSAVLLGSSARLFMMRMHRSARRDDAGFEQSVAVAGKTA